MRTSEVEGNQIAAGNLYGTAEQGGNTSACGGFGCGVVFEIAGADTKAFRWPRWFAIATNRETRK
jgi:hypothetical protein